VSTKEIMAFGMPKSIKGAAFQQLKIATVGEITCAGGQ
jgi:hypothetical protein